MIIQLGNIPRCLATPLVLCIDIRPARDQKFHYYQNVIYFQRYAAVHTVIV